MVRLGFKLQIFLIPELKLLTTLLVSPSSSIPSDPVGNGFRKSVLGKSFIKTKIKQPLDYFPLSSWKNPQRRASQRPTQEGPSASPPASGNSWWPCSKKQGYFPRLNLGPDAWKYLLFMSRTKKMLWEGNVVRGLKYRILESSNSWGEVCWIWRGEGYIKQEKSGNEKVCVIRLIG